jgi:hypothetical protein
LIFIGFECFIEFMNLLNLTLGQLKRAAAIKEQIEILNKELRSIFDGPGANGLVAIKKKRTMSAAVKRKIAAAQKARWAKRKRT